MGCTGKGTPNTIPVTIFHTPQKTSVADKDIEPWIARAIISGRSVPRSPKDPDISAKGDFRKVDILFVWIRLSLEKAMASVLQDITPLNIYRIDDSYTTIMSLKKPIVTGTFDVGLNFCLRLKMNWRRPLQKSRPKDAF